MSYFSDRKERKELKNQVFTKELKPLIKPPAAEEPVTVKQPLQPINQTPTTVTAANQQQQQQKLSKSEATLYTGKQNVVVNNEQEHVQPTRRDRKLSHKEDQVASTNKTNSKTSSASVRRSKTTNVIAGNVNSGLGSPKNFTTNLPAEDAVWTKNNVKTSAYYSSELLHDEDYDNKRPSIAKTNMELRHSFYSLNRNVNGDVQIPINVHGENAIPTYPDARVAYRLASNEFLYKN